MSTASFDPWQAPIGSPESAWVSRQIEAMATALRRGEAMTAEDVLVLRPDLGADHAVRLIYEEILLRRELGQDLPTDEVVRRFPRWGGELELLLDCDRLLGSPPAGVAFPAAGDDLGSFRVIEEIGRGASGRIYLATDPALADRPVVLKVVPSDHDEHLSLARLQHTHIVPLYCEQVFPELGLRALCMPALGGASLAQILDALASIPVKDRRGHHLAAALDLRSPPWPSTTAAGPCRRYLEQATYTDAICWIAACLADALQYAHDRGLVHMDVKPSNVLIAGDGQPMLLDFHLARTRDEGDGSAGDRLGGTPGWMSPEQREAVESIRRGDRQAGRIDGRSDVFSVGLLMCEALRGPGSAAAAASGRLPRFDPVAVSVGLGDIIAKCLAADPSERYQDAATLADDLRRHLNDLPLRGVVNRSVLERSRKWRRRRPGAMARTTAWISALAALILAVVVAGASHRQRLVAIADALQDGRRLIAAHQYGEAVRALGRGLDQARSAPLANRLTDELESQLRNARRSQALADLHDLADAIRFRYGVALPESAEARELLRHCGEIWRDRDALLTPTAALDAEREARLRTDLLELAVVWADLRVHLSGPPDAAEAAREARTILDEARAVFGPSPALERRRRALLLPARRIETASATDPPPRTAWEHYDLGRYYLRNRQDGEAAEEFRLALDLRPQDFWPNFYQGLCAYRLGRFEDALAAFRSCLVLEPDAAECYHNRALAAEALGRTEQAIDDYGRALAREPGLVASALNRGILLLTSGRHDDAVAELGRALDAASHPETIAQIEYNLALALLSRGDRPSALANAERAASRGDREAARLRDRLRDAATKTGD